MNLQTEFPFTLPRGYVDSEGRVHKKGIMRLATAKDEVTPLQDHRVKANARASKVVPTIANLDVFVGRHHLESTQLHFTHFET